MTVDQMNSPRLTSGFITTRQREIHPENRTNDTTPLPARPHLPILPKQEWEPSGQTGPSESHSHSDCHPDAAFSIPAQPCLWLSPYLGPCFEHNRTIQVLALGGQASLTSPVLSAYRITEGPGVSLWQWRRHRCVYGGHETRSGGDAYPSTLRRRLTLPE